MDSRILIKKINKDPALIIFSSDKKTIYKVRIKKYFTIGRNTDSSHVDISVESKFFPRKNGIIEYYDDAYYYMALRNSNATYLNGIKLKEEEKHKLCDGDVLQVFEWADRQIQNAVTMVFVIDYIDNFTVNSVETIGDNFRTVVGNDKADDTIEFFMAKNGLAVSAQESATSVNLNGKKLEKAKYLRIGDCVRIDNICFFYSGNSIVYQNPVNKNTSFQSDSDVLDICIKERSVWQHSKKLVLLKDISIKINPGEMVLILGGSGAGKTTFMNAVMGYEKAQGKIMLGDTDIYADYESIKSKIGFVPQQDLVRGSDTVYNTLENAAEMKLSREIKKDERNTIIESVLKTFSLWEVKDHLISKLAGGQKKRISVAIEYIANPSLFFLDEPDSGLDGPEASKLMQNLRRIADEGKTVMVISHIPDRASNLFDKVIVLAKSKKTNCGHLAFFGSIKEALNYFETDTLEGVVKRINTDGLSDYYIDKYKKG